MESTQVAIVIPAYNESQTIKCVIDELKEELIGHNFEVIVVNDCSTDDTSDIATATGAKVINLTRNYGYSGAIEQGFNYVTTRDFDYVLTMDADGQHHPSSVKKIIECLEQQKPKMVIGDRGEYARLGEWLYGKVFERLLGIKDPLCGLKAYAVDAYREIGFFESFDSIGSELSVRMLNKEAHYCCSPVIIRNRKGEARFGNGLKVELRLIKSLYKSISFITKNFKKTERQNSI
ncbi:glycosyltransferase family 2 protein [Alteromonas sp. LMIT006]|uniref:glycosyltransferase family 2 protein n=1 Tax=Alteromonadaceae TaxID=72275 RepID=UPI0020CA2E02|nr:glycosyltransferase family 2 protein [Alteromonas sp. LMIT006]UTP71911.1 glycosyltransferase family 2 protein [Alteromonas sp. LMIT006]